MGQGGSTGSDLAALEQSSHLSREQLEVIHGQFCKKYCNGKMMKSEFIQELSAISGTKELWENVYTRFDPNDSGYIDFTEFVLGLSMLRSGSSTDKLKFAFKLFDKDGNGFLDGHETKELVNRIFSLRGSITLKGAPMKTLMKLAALRDSEEPTGIQISEEEFISMCRTNNSLMAAVEECVMGVVDIREDLTNSAESFNHQAAGHKGDEKGMKKQGDMILKHFSEKEFEFYEKLRKEPPDTLKMFPKYKGRTRIKNSLGTVDHYILLEDLTHGMKHPCICDLKMGCKTHEEDAPLKKRLVQTSIDTMSTSKALGFRVCGIRSWQVDAKTYDVKDKPWGLALSNTRMDQALKIFFSNGKSIRYEVVGAMIPKLLKILKWFQQQTKYKFIGSSILLVYDGDISGLGSGASTKDIKFDVRLVDFAHTVDVDKPDIEYIVGLKNLIQYLKTIYDERTLYTGGKTHNFKLTYFPKPTFCKYCTKFIWGVHRKQGFRCLGTYFFLPGFV